MKALILSGGSGSRLRPLTFTTAKQLLPLANQPVLFYIIEKVVAAGIRDIGIIVGHTHEEVKQVVGNGERWNASISYIHQEKPLGLGHAVKEAKGYIGDDDFLMILGDNVFSTELAGILQNFYDHKANTTLMLHWVNNPSAYGVAVVQDRQIVRLVEKPKEPISNLILTGIYVFDQSIFNAIDHTAPSPRGELEITDAIQKQIEMGGIATYETITGWWKDTGKLDDMLEANRLIMGSAPYTQQQIAAQQSVCSGKIWLGENVSIQNCKIVGPVSIGDNVRLIDSYIGPFTAIGNDTIVNHCELDNSIVLEHTLLEHLEKRISGSLIGKNTIIKAQQAKPHSSGFLIGDNCEIYM